KDLSTFLHCGQQLAFYVEATIIFAHLFPYAYGLRRIMLPQKFDGSRRLCAQAVSERTWHNLIASHIHFMEDRAITFKLTCISELLQVEFSVDLLQRHGFACGLWHQCNGSVACPSIQDFAVNSRVVQHHT